MQCCSVDCLCLMFECYVFSGEVANRLVGHPLQQIVSTAPRPLMQIPTQRLVNPNSMMATTGVVPPLMPPQPSKTKSNRKSKNNSNSNASSSGLSDDSVPASASSSSG